METVSCRLPSLHNAVGLVECSKASRSNQYYQHIFAGTRLAYTAVQGVRLAYCCSYCEWKKSCSNLVDGLSLLDPITTMFHSYQYCTKPTDFRILSIHSCCQDFRPQRFQAQRFSPGSQLRTRSNDQGNEG